MKIRTLFLGTIAGMGALAAMSVSASAYVACNRFGDCWHTTDRYTYQPAWGITVHNDVWHWRGNHYHWHEHDGRGYWRQGVWVTF